jgi:biotin transport system substrate-specific component
MKIIRSGELSLKKAQESALLAKMFGVISFVVLLCFSAYVKVPLPFTPIPITLQNLVVFLAGAFLGPVGGALSVGIYLTLGLLGVPLFANAGFGFLYLFGPTGGYIFGFILAAGLIGALAARLRGTFLLNYGVMLAGMLSVYLCGGLWLAIGYHWDIRKIFFLGVLPFLPADLVKAALAAAFTKLWRRP